MSKILGVVFSAAEAMAIQAFAAKLNLPFDLLQFSGNAVADCGAQTVFSAGLPDAPLADSASKTIAEQAGGYSHIISVSSMASKDVLARVAGLLDCAMVTDAIQANSAQSFVRPIVAGTILATVECDTFPVVITFRPAGFPAVAPAPVGSTHPLSVTAPSKATLVGRSQGASQRPDLTQAKIIVSGGRPLKDAATFESVIGGLADALGGAAGATRAAVDSGIAPNDLQVGQTGKVVAPDLYIAAGISGSTQHVAGIKDSKVIVAINKDPEAPIFEVADFGLVADLFDAIPEIRKLIDR